MQLKVKIQERVRRNYFANFIQNNIITYQMHACAYVTLLFLQRQKQLNPTLGVALIVVFLFILITILDILKRGR